VTASAQRTTRGVLTFGSDMTELLAVTALGKKCFGSACWSRCSRDLRNGSGDRSLAGITVSFPAAGMDISLLWVLYIIMLRSLRQADHFSRGDPPCVCTSHFDSEASKMRRIWPNRGCRFVEKNASTFIITLLKPMTFNISLKSLTRYDVGL